MSKSWWICSRSQGTGLRSRGPTPTGTSLASSVSWRLSSTAGRCSRSFSPALPLTSPTRSTSSASEPNSTIHLDAVFSPTPGMLGRLSLGSPRRAAKSGYWAGVRPYFSISSPGVNRVVSVTPRAVFSTVTRSLMSWNASRSPVTITTSMSSAAAWVASVAMRSSASYPASDTRGMPSASSTSKIRLSWLRKSAGVSRRLALYSTYCSCRKVGSLRSKATAMWVGFSIGSILMSIAVKP